MHLLSIFLIYLNIYHVYCLMALVSILLNLNDSIIKIIVSNYYYY